jgi:pimeloyl-ACP methyl ester carboxylesterase
MLQGLRAQLEAGIIFEEALPTLAPGRAGDGPFTRWMGRYLRMATGIGGAAAMLDRFQEIDIRPVLPDVTVPVLTLHRAQDRLIPAGNATFLATHVRDGRAVILPGADSVLWAGDVDAVASEVERFLWNRTHTGG